MQQTERIVLEQARREKEMQCKLVVTIETGGWSEGAAQVLRQLSHAKAREVPSFIRPGLDVGNEGGCDCSQWHATSFAASPVDPASHVTWCHTGGEGSVLADLFEADPRPSSDH